MTEETRELDPRDLSKHQQRQLRGGENATEETTDDEEDDDEQHDRWIENPPIGDLAEELAAEEYNLSTSNSGSWWDAVSPDGNRTEVKSTTARIGDDYPADGRFRVWEGQTTQLVEEERDDDSVTTWYVFVLFHERDGKLYLHRMKPTDVLSLVTDDRGGWNQAGHEDQGRQHKLPWQAVIDRSE